MSGWELLDSCAATGMNKYIASDPEDDDRVLVRYEQTGDSLQRILDRNKATQNESFDKKADMWHAGHIPVGVIYEWITKHGVNVYNPAHEDGVTRLLNDPDYRYLRVSNFIL